MKAVLAALLIGSPLAAAAETLTLDPSTGSLRALVYKEGPLAAFGHDHVVRAASFRGVVELSSASAALTLSVDARALTIDEPKAREAEGWRPIAEKDRREIEAAMRGPKGLDVEKRPELELRSESIEPVAQEKDTWLLTGRLLLHGAAQAIEAPVVVSSTPAGAWFSGYVRLRPSDYGVKPFSVFAGAVRTKDEAVVKFDLLGRRAPR